MASDNEASCVSDPNFAVICSFLECFGKSCAINYPDIKSLQDMLEDVHEVKQPLVDLHIKLLRKARKSVSPEKWERSLVKFCHTYSNQDGWELERFGYKKARITVKLRLLKVLLEAQFDLNPKFKAEVNKLAADQLRVEPLGRDKTGLSYWFQLDEECNVRVYREDLDEENWQLVASDREGVVSLINSLSDGEGGPIPIEEDSNSLEISEKPIIDTGQPEESLSPKEDPPLETEIVNGSKMEIEDEKIPSKLITKKVNSNEVNLENNANGEEEGEDDEDEDDEEEEGDDDDDEEASNEESSKQNSDDEDDDDEDDDDDDDEEGDEDEDSQDATETPKKIPQLVTSSKIVENHVPPVIIRTQIRVANKEAPGKASNEIIVVPITKHVAPKLKAVEITPVKAIETPVITTSPLKLVNIQDLQKSPEDRVSREEKYPSKPILPFQAIEPVTLGKLSIKPIEKLAANLSRIQSEKLEKPGAAKLLEKIAENLARSSGVHNVLSNGDDEKLQQELASRNLAEKSNIAGGRNQRGMDLSTSPRGWEKANDHTRPMDYSGIDLSSRKPKKSSSDHLASSYRGQDFQHREMDLSTRKIGKLEAANHAYDPRTVILRNHTMVTDLSKKQMYSGYEIPPGSGYHNSTRISGKEDHRLPNYTILPDPSKIASMRLASGSLKRPHDMVEDPQQEMLKRMRAEGLSLRGSMDKRASTMVGGLRRDEVGPAIEEPLMMVHGEGSGSDCDAVNLGLGEAIEEPVIFFYGTGAGHDCDTGNPGDDTSSDNKESNESKNEGCSDVTTTVSPTRILTGDESVNEASSAGTMSPIKTNANFSQANSTSASDNCQSTIVSSMSPKSRFKPTLGIQVISKSGGSNSKKSSRWDVGRPAGGDEECDSSIISSEEGHISTENESITTNEYQNKDTDRLNDPQVAESKSESDDITSTSNQSFPQKNIDECSSSVADNEDVVKLHDSTSEPDSSVVTDTTSAIEDEKIEPATTELSHCDSSAAASSSVDPAQAVESTVKGDNDTENNISSKNEVDDSDSMPRFFFGPNCVSYPAKDEEALGNQAATTSVDATRETLEHAEVAKNNNNFVKIVDNYNSESSDASSGSNIETKLKNVDLSDDKSAEKCEEPGQSEYLVQSSTSLCTKDETDFVSATQPKDFPISELEKDEKISGSIETSMDIEECPTKSDVSMQSASDCDKEVDPSPTEVEQSIPESIVPSVTPESIELPTKDSAKDEEFCEVESSTSLNDVETPMEVESEEKNVAQEFEKTVDEPSMELPAAEQSKEDDAQEIGESSNFLPPTISDETESCTLPEVTEDSSQMIETSDEQQVEQKQLEFSSDAEEKTKQSCDSESDDTIARIIEKRNDKETSELCSDDAQDGFAQSSKEPEDTKTSSESSCSNIAQLEKSVDAYEDKSVSAELPGDSSADSAAPSLTSLIVNPSGDNSMASDRENFEPPSIPTSVGPFVDEDEIISARVSPAQIVDSNISKSPERITVESEKASGSSRLLDTLDTYTDDISEKESSADQDSNEAMVIDDRASDSNSSAKDTLVVGEEKLLDFKDKVTSVEMAVENIEENAAVCDPLQDVPCEASTAEASVEKLREAKDTSIDEGKEDIDTKMDESEVTKIDKDKKSDDSVAVQAQETDEKELPVTSKSDDNVVDIVDVQEQSDASVKSSLVPNYECSEDDDVFEAETIEVKEPEDTLAIDESVLQTEQKIETLSDVDSKSLEASDSKTRVDDKIASETESKMDEEEPKASCKNSKDFSELEDEENEDSTEKLHIDLSEPKKIIDAVASMEVDEMSSASIERSDVGDDKISPEVIEQSSEGANEICNESRNLSDDVLSTSEEKESVALEKEKETVEQVVAANKTGISDEIPSAVDSELKATESEEKQLEIVERETISDNIEKILETAESVAETIENKNEDVKSLAEDVGTSNIDANIAPDVEESSTKIDSNEDPKEEKVTDEKIATVSEIQELTTREETENVVAEKDTKSEEVSAETSTVEKDADSHGVLSDIVDVVKDTKIHEVSTETTAVGSPEVLTEHLAEAKDTKNDEVVSETVAVEGDQKSPEILPGTAAVEEDAKGHEISSETATVKEDTVSDEILSETLAVEKATKSHEVLPETVAVEKDTKTHEILSETPAVEKDTKGHEVLQEIVAVEKDSKSHEISAETAAIEKDTKTHKTSVETATVEKDVERDEVLSEIEPVKKDPKSHEVFSEIVAVEKDAKSHEVLSEIVAVEKNTKTPDVPSENVAVEKDPKSHEVSSETVAAEKDTKSHEISSETSSVDKDTKSHEIPSVTVAVEKDTKSHEILSEIVVVEKSSQSHEVMSEFVSVEKDVKKAVNKESKSHETVAVKKDSGSHEVLSDIVAVEKDPTSHEVLSENVIVEKDTKRHEVLSETVTVKKDSKSHEVLSENVIVEKDTKSHEVLSETVTVEKDSKSHEVLSENVVVEKDSKSHEVLCKTVAVEKDIKSHKVLLESVAVEKDTKSDKVLSKNVAVEKAPKSEKVLSKNVAVEKDTKSDKALSKNVAVEKATKSDKVLSKNMAVEKAPKSDKVLSKNVAVEKDTKSDKVLSKNVTVKKDTKTFEVLAEIAENSVEPEKPEKLSSTSKSSLPETSIKKKDEVMAEESFKNLEKDSSPKVETKVLTRKSKAISNLPPKREKIKAVPLKNDKKEASKRLRGILDAEDIPPSKSKPPNVDIVKDDTSVTVEKRRLRSRNDDKRQIVQKVVASVEPPPQVVTAFASVVTSGSSTRHSRSKNLEQIKNHEVILLNSAKPSIQVEISDTEKSAEIQSVDVKCVDLESDDSMGIDNDNIFGTAADEVDPLACTEEELKSSVDPLIVPERKIGIRVKPVKDLYYDGWKLDSPDTTPVLPTVSRKRRNSPNESPNVTIKPVENDEGETVGKRMKLRGKRTPDINLRKTVELSRTVTVSSEDEEPKAELSDEVIVIKEITEDAAAIAKSKGEGKPRGRPRGKRRRGNRMGGRLTRSQPAPSSTPVKAASPKTPAPVPVAAPVLTPEPAAVAVVQTESKKKRKKRKMVLGLEIGIDIPVPQTAGGRDEIPVRQSRRIAQIKIKEEADKRRIEEETFIDIKGKKDRDGSEKKKRKKQKPDSEEEPEVIVKEIEREVKSKKKRKKKKLSSKFNEAHPWQSSSGSSTEEECQEDEDEDEIESEGSILFKSDHEFSPESDLEKDEESEPLRRARTAQKSQSDVEEAEDEYACQKCGKADHPDWILLCDTCDKGWHCSCLRPALMLIPEGDWFCPPCQHTVLVTKLREGLRTFDQNSKRHENEVLRKKRLAFVGISLDNVLNKNDNIADNSSSSRSDSSSSSSESSSSSSSSDESEPVYQLRERRCANTYKFNEYDDMINAAIGDEVEAVRVAGNQGRGKDIATIVNAEKEEAEGEAYKLSGLIDADEDDEKKKSEKESDEDYKEEKEEIDDEEENTKRKAPPVKKVLSRKKHRKLNSLDVSSEDDPESDEDFKGSSSDDEDDYEEQLDSSDDSFAQSKRRGRKGDSRPVRRSTRAARKTRYDEDFINDDSDDNDRHKRKKSRSVWEGSESEDSDNSWRQKKKKSRTVPTSRFRAKTKTKSIKKKKRKRIIEPDNASDNEEAEAEPEPKVEEEVKAEVETKVETETEAINEEVGESKDVPATPQVDPSNESENVPVTEENHETEKLEEDNKIETSIDDEEQTKKKKKESSPKQKKGPGIRRKIVYGGLGDDGPRQEEETPSRRTRGRKINYQDIMGSDSEEELKKVLRKTEESEDEFVVNEGEDLNEDVEKDSDSGDIYSPNKEISKGKAKSPKAKRPKISKSPGGRKSVTDNGTPKERKKPGPKPGSKNRLRADSLSLGSIVKPKDSDSLTHGIDMEGSTMSATGSVIGEVPEGSLTGLEPEDMSALDDEQLERMMMEDEEYGRRQLELAAIEIARNKKQEEKEAKKLEKARLKALEILAAEQQMDPTAQDGTDGELPKKKKRGRRSKAEILAEQMRREGVPSLLSGNIMQSIIPDVGPVSVATATIVSPNVTPTHTLPTVVQPPIDTERSPDGQMPLMAVPDGQLFSPDGSPMKPKRRGRGKGKKTLALEAARAAEASGKAGGDIGAVGAFGITGTDSNPEVKTDDIPNVLPTPGSSTSGSAPPTPPASVVTSQGLPPTLSPNQQQQQQQQQPPPPSVYPGLPPSQQSSVITRMLQSQPVSNAPQSFTAAATAMGHKYFGAPNAAGQMMPGPRGASYDMSSRGRIPSPYRQSGPSPMPPHFAAVRSGAPPMRMRVSGPQLYHTPHHPMDPSPSGGGPISINSRDRSSPLGPVPGPGSGPQGSAMIPPAAGSPLAKGGPTPPPPPYARGGPALSRFPDNPQMGPRHQIPPFSPTASTNHNMQQPSPPPNRPPGNFSPYHPPPPPNYHYGAYPPPPPMTTADDAAAYQGSPYSAEHFSTPADSQPQIQQPQPPPPQPQPGPPQSHPNEPPGPGNKQYDEEGSGEFGGLVSYFSSQREDDLDS